MQLPEDNLIKDSFQEFSREELLEEIIRLKKALTKAEEQKELILKATNDAVYEWDLLSGHLSWSEGFLTLIGYDRASIAHTIDFWSSHLHPEEKQRVEASLEALFQTGGSHWQEEYRFRRKDGSYAYVLERGYVVYDSQNKAVRMVGAIQDVSKHKQAELAKEIISKEYTFLVNEIPILVFSNASDGGADFVNRQWLVYTGLSMEQILGDGWTKALHPQDVVPTLQARQRAVTNGTSYQIQLRLRRKDGIYRWFQVDVLPYKDQDGSILKWFGTYTDIEEVKQSQSMLEATLEELHEKNFELDQFVYKTSHDLRAPLTSILGLVTIIRGEKEEKTKMAYVELIEGRVLKLDAFIKSMLAYSRNARTPVKEEHIHFPTLIEECLAELSSPTGVERLKLSTHLDGEIFYSDAFRLKMIFSNLLSNAIKYQDFSKDESFLKITIDISPSQGRIIFEDNGVGVKEAYQGNLFDMFFRATDQSEGSGLGLYIVKQAVNVLQGSITLKSQFRKGTFFSLTLPNRVPL
ncbi:PAS domain-containing protein [Rhodocytophaga aerolata]|uniref:histidine kinase n=1 Tax=Rhodocytophaga aerolata TaxID=455078 RepID=A0ABT8RFD3_9BACT|nr:PAS domain-containing protein [Rhodocytophaga aerolata]MDO1450813.1 PAS domain-containing protein [Rhodocytophaga aerolata]